jgi:hypothetical protein
LPEIIILGTITGDTIGSTAGAPGMVITGPAIGIHIALRLAIVMINTVGRGGMTEVASVWRLMSYRYPEMSRK